MSTERILDGQAAIIVGAGAGIGRSCALALARDGADVVLAARRPGPLQILADEVHATHRRRAIAVPTDISDLAQCAALVDATVAELGRIDIVVTVATTSGAHATVEELDFADYRRAFDLNVLGVLEVSRLAAAHMRAVGGGSIVQIGSLVATSMLVKQRPGPTKRR
jgi:NAD(P)-dependent dehydrogenase (short-subunit alcohol dehydrogenase family)